jgi:hypothetical protein
MPIVKPTKPDHTIEVGDSSMTVYVPRRHFMLLALAFGFIGIVYLIHLLSDLPFLRTDSTLMAFSAFVAVWVFLWAIYMLVLATAGREIIEVSQQSIVIKRKIIIGNTALPTTPSKEYLMKHIKNLRTWPALRWSGGGALAFDYGAKTVRFAAGIDDAEARQILERLKQSLPWLPCG